MKLNPHIGHRDALQELLSGLKSEYWLLLAVKVKQARLWQMPVTVSADYWPIL